jgi:SAM-dependent methyltransferase
MSSYILEYIPKIFPLIEANNITSLIVPAGYNASVVIPLTLQENETKTYVVIGDKNVIDNYQDSDFITYISSKDMITLLLSYLDKKNDINDLCHIIILSELYPGELYYETIFSLWLHLENIFDGIPRLIILNSKPYEVPNSAKFEIKNPITPKYEYIDISKDKLYREIAKLIKNKIKLDNFNMVVIVPNIEELDPYLETYAKTEIKTDLYIADDKLSNKILLITTPDKVSYNYLPNTRYVIELLTGVSVDSETAKQHESLINVAKNGIFTRMISKEDYGKLPKKFKYNLDQTELIGIMVEILKVKVSPDSILKNIDKSLITNLIKLIDKINLVDIPKLNNFVDSLNLNFRNSSFLWYWIRGDRFNSRIIEEGKKYDMNFEEIEIDQSSLFSSIEPYHLPSISAIFDSEKLNPEIIIDATANIGGDSINFMRLFPSARLTSLELDAKISYILKRNMNNLKNILSQDNDYDTKVFNISAVNYFSEPRYADMIYFDPPWGGRDYIKLDKIQLYLDDISIGNIIKNILTKGMTLLVILKLPVNADIDIIKSDIGSEINVTYSLYDVENYNKNKIAYQLMFIRSGRSKLISYLSEDPKEVKLLPTTNTVFDGIVIASLIDTFNESYFKFPDKSRNYSQSQYDKILADHKKKYFDKYIGYNDLETFLNLWNDYIDHSDDVEIWIKENSINYDKFVKLIQTVNDIMTILGGYFEISILNVDSVDAVNIARPILASIYSDLTYIDPYNDSKNKLYFNELKPSEKYSLDKKDGVSEMLENPPLGIIALHTKIFENNGRIFRLIDFGVDTDKTGRGLPIMKKENKNIIKSIPKSNSKLIIPNLQHGILKQNPFDILNSLMITRQIYPLILKSIDIKINDPILLKIAKKITGSTSNDLISILENYQGVNIGTTWASKTIKSSDRFDDILKYIDTSNVNTYLDIGSGDAVDFNFMVNKLNPERSISVDIKDSRLEKSFEFHILEIDNPLLLPGNSVDIITIFHALHHSSDALFRLRDVYRLLKVGGLFILKDHNVTNLDIANNVSFEHFVYSIGEGTATLENAKNYNEIEPMYYYSADYIKNYLTNLGFEVVMFQTYENPTKTYKAIFRKV